LNCDYNSKRRVFKTFAQNKTKFKKFQYKFKNNVAQHRENKFKKLSFKTNTLSLNLLYYVSNFIQGIYPGNYPGKLSRELSREGYTPPIHPLSGYPGIIQGRVYRPV